MTSDELASQEVLAKRLKEQREEDESRRLDWADEHKAEIQRELGIDPDNDWDFEEIVVSDNDD